MGLGYLKVVVHTGDDALPVKDAQVLIKDSGGKVLYHLETDGNGHTEQVELPAPDKYHTLDPDDPGPYYGTYEVNVLYQGRYITTIVHDVQIYDTIEAILPIDFMPLPENSDQLVEEYYIPAPAVRSSDRDERTMISPFILRDVIIPDYITVHLGTPTSNASNVRVRFADYIKNVASSEIYPTWPQSSLEANILAQISFALNRVFTEWYRSRGFDFDITNSTTVDQYFVYGRDIFTNISRIVDNIFNSFVRRPGRLEPFFTQFCNGTTATCPGLSQWGTVTLANQGFDALAILRHYYPRDVQIVTSDNIQGITESYPGIALREGDRGQYVRLMQDYLNRIRANFPLIPQIANPNGAFEADTKQTVIAFQNVFNLVPDGIIGRATWYKIVQIFVAVSKLASLDSEGKRIGIGANPPNVVLREGASGPDVIELQFLINYIGQYFPTVIPVIQDNMFRNSTTSSVRSFQRTFGLLEDGIVGPVTWRKLYDVFRAIEKNIPKPPAPPATIPPFPGTLLRLGSRGNSVRTMQEFLNVIGTEYPSIVRLATDGIFGPITLSAVREFQRIFGLNVDGIIGPITWAQIVKERNRILNN